MKNHSLLIRLFAVVAVMMCALGAAAAEAYACYTPSNTTLTFYYDNLRSSRTGTTYDLNTGNTDVAWDTDGTNYNVTKVVFDPSFAGARPTTTCDWFYGMGNLESITGMSYLNTSEVTNMNWMFMECYKLTSLDLSHFNTSNVISMTQMFEYCLGLTSLDLSSFNTANVTGMSYMFNGCTNLQTIYVGNGWSTAAVTESSDMFTNCFNLVGGKGTTYDANHVDKTYAHIDGGPSNPGYFSAEGDEPWEAYACYTSSNTTLTFYYDDQRDSRPGTTYNLNTGINETGWETDGINASVTKVVFDPSFADARPTTTSGWFFAMNNLQSITGISYLNTSEVTNMAWMFQECRSLISLDVSHFNTAKVTSMLSMFDSCHNLTTLDLSSFNTAKVTNMDYMFSNCNMTSLDLTSFNTAKVTKMDYMFSGCSNLARIYVGENWTTAAVTQSSDMFKNCTSLVGGQGTTYDANHVDKAYAHVDGGPSNPGYLSDDPNAPMPPTAYACSTSSNTTLTFYYDNQRSSRTGTTYSLNTGTIFPGWKTDGTNANVTKVVFDSSFADARPTSTYYWFSSMGNLSSIEGIEYLNTSEVTNMGFMFNDCRGLTSLDLSSFNTSKVTKMVAMFQGCESLTSLDMSGFNTANVTDMSAMFNVCRVLTSLNLTCFNTANVTDMHYMFKACSLLSTIYVSDNWSTAAVTKSEDMFKFCTSLVGGQGTTYDANHVDKTYAHIDGGPSNPGYLTRDPNAPVAYACYHAGYSTLTFYYDNQKSSRPGEIFDLNEGSENPVWYDNGWSYEVTKVVFDPSFADARPTTTVNWFAEMYDLTSVEGIENLNTSEVTDMGGMFWECGSLPYVDVSGFDTHNVTNMNSMFAECYELTGLDVSGFDTRNVTSMESMFGNCSELTFLDVSGFNTAKVTSMYNLFGGCGLTSLDLHSFDTHNVTNMCYMFSSCSELKTIYVGEGWTTAGVTVSDEMFYYCLSIVGGQGTTYDPSNPKDKTYAHIDGGPSNPGYFTEFKEAYACYTPESTTLTFYYDNQRSSRPGTTYDLNTGSNDTGWDTDGTNASVTKVVFDPSFADARPTTTCDWFYGMVNLQSIEGMNYLNTSQVTNMGWMFSTCTKLTNLDVSHFNTSNVTEMSFMFAACNVTSLDLSSFNTSQVIFMTYMFRGSNNLQTIYAGNGWSTAAVTGSTEMFYNCTSLVGGMGTTYDANHVDKTYAHIDGGPSNPGYFTDSNGPRPYACYTPENTTLTFYYDNQRSSRPGTTYDLNTGTNNTGWESDGTKSNVTKVVFDSSFATARPTTTYSWFYAMENLQSITGISYLNTSEVTNMAYMFTYCESLTSLDLSGFNTSQVTDMNYMFFFSSNLRTIYVGDNWSTAAVANSNYMFSGCTSLVGGQGTTYDPYHVDAEYAHIDRGPSDPGYFTDKNASLRGDVNGDTHVSIADVTALIDYLLSHDASSINVDAADCNQDTNVSIADVTALIDYLLSGAW